jgi:ferric-dicitrate binding protein FerR (iron transport regulator)
MAGEASADELKDLSALMQQYPEWQYAAQTLQEMWQHKMPEGTDSDGAFERHLQRMQDAAAPPVGQAGTHEPTAITIPGRRHTAWWRYAAVAAAIAALVWVLWPARSPQGGAGGTMPTNEITTRKGSKSKVLLPDGTTVWLNAGSRLTYADTYGKKDRTVTLSGEAYFDVKHNPSLPFELHTTHLHITVLGTVFNVKAYPDESTTETSLLKGRIEVEVKDRPGDKIILTPNQKLLVENNEAGTTANATTKNDAAPEPLIVLSRLKTSPLVGVIAETAWLDNQLVFNNEPFEELALKMERWYNVSISIEDSSLLGKRLTGNFENENIDEALTALSIAQGFTYQRQGNNIRIYQKQN